MRRGDLPAERKGAEVVEGIVRLETAAREDRTPQVRPAQLATVEGVVEVRRRLLGATGVKDSC